MKTKMVLQDNHKTYRKMKYLTKLWIHFKNHQTEIVLIKTIKNYEANLSYNKSRANAKC